MRETQAFPVHAVVRLRFPQMQQQAMTQPPHRHGRLPGQITQDRNGRRAAEQVKRIAHERQRRLMIEEFCRGHRLSFAPRKHNPMREGKLLAPVFEMWRQRDELSVKVQRLAALGELKAAGVPPARQPLQQFRVRQNQRVRPIVAIAVRIGNPLDEFPIGGRKQFLFVRGADNQVHHLAERARLFAGARARQQKPHRQPVMQRFVFAGLHATNDPERGARRVQQRHRGRSKPLFQFPHQFRLLLGLLGLGKTVGTRVGRKLRRHGTLRAQEKKGQLFKPRLAGHLQQARPPVRIGKILPRQQQFFEIILEQEPRALRIRTVGKTPQ